MPQTTDVIDQFAERYAAENTAGSSERYAMQLRSFENWLENRGKDIATVADDVTARTADGVTTEDVLIYLNHMTEDGYSDSTVKVTRAAISQFYQYLRVDNPVEHLQQSWSTTTLKESAADSAYGFQQLKTDEVAAIIENVPNPQFRNKLLVRLLAQTGVRRGELVNIRLQDIDRDNRTINIDSEKNTGYRTVTYDTSLKTPLQIWIENKRGHVYGVDEDTEWLFPSRRGGHIGGHAVNEIVKQGAENAGLQDTYATDRRGRNQNKITAHSLRHYYALECARNGMKAAFLRKLMGHTKIEITQIYLQAAEDTTVEMGQKYGPSV